MSLTEHEHSVLDNLLNRLVAIEQGINKATRELADVKVDIKQFLQDVKNARK